MIPLTPARRTIAARMLESQQTIPAAWMAVEADVTGLVARRAAMKETFAKAEGVELTYMPFFVEAVVAAMKEHPAINAVFTDEGIRPLGAYDVGIAVATDWGLVVPVLRNAGDLSIAGLAKELKRLADLAQSRKLAIEDTRGAAVTVNNTGSFGSIISQPIVPPGGTAVIATEAIRREVRARDDGAISVRSVMNVSISFDHRLLDGDAVGRFMQGVKAHLEAF
jgi:2-oxoisovalerate dehydrogenase E2 component (dihydrolipoyl transacylase)